MSRLEAWIEVYNSVSSVHVIYTLTLKIQKLEIPSFYLSLLDNNMKSIWSKCLQQLHLLLICVNGVLAGDQRVRVTLCCKGKQ